MFNNHLNYYMPNFSLPPPPPPLPRPLNSARVFFRPHSQHQPFYPQSNVHPHMNPQFFNLSVPPPPLAQNIASLISTNINNYPTRHPVNGTHHLTTSERFSKTFHNGRLEKGLASKSNGLIDRPRKRFLEQITNEESTFGELRIELDTAPRSQPLSGLSANDIDTEAVNESPKSKESGCSENSQESINLVPTNNDSDGEHPEMGRNWRMLMLFNGLVKDEDLAPNCERPQTDEGRTYPDIQKKEATQKPEQQTEREQERQQLYKPLSSKSLPDKNLEVASTASVSELSKAIRTNNVWVSSDLLAKMKLQQQQMVSFASKNCASSGHTISSPVAHDSNNLQPITNETDLRQLGTRNRLHRNRSLIILKNGRRVYAGSKDCFQFLETGNCLSGVFCEFEHEGVNENAAKKVCPNLMRGQCRNSDDTCPNGPHSTLKAHQMPVCDYYLRMCCSKGKDQCSFLHVKHTDGMDPCEEFNKGCCQQGVMVCLSAPNPIAPFPPLDTGRFLNIFGKVISIQVPFKLQCDAPHRYRYYRIKEKQMEPPKQSANQQNPVTESHDNAHSNSTDNQNDILKWFS